MNDAEHTAAIAFWQRRLAEALRDSNMGLAQMCLHNIRQHCDQLDYWIVNRTAAKIAGI